MRRLIYPATRAIEDAQSLPGIQPMRFFPVLWPLWQVETSAEVYESQDYELIDYFVVRAIEEGGIHDRAELIRFLNLPAGLVDRCVAFLTTIQHLVVRGPRLDLTPLGQHSAREGRRFVPTTSRLTVLIERQTGQPFPRRYYNGDVQVLDTPEIEEGQLADRTRFLRVFTATAYDPQALIRLANDPTRAQLNLPSQFRNVREEGHRDGFLPSYLIETIDHQILAYTSVSEKRDDFLEGLCTVTSVEHLIEAMGIRDPKEVWTAWLAGSTAFNSGRLHQPRDGAWQVILGDAAFGDSPKPPVTSIGSYRVKDNHFIQIWCADVRTRRRALVERSVGLATLPSVECEEDLQVRIRDLAAKLQVDEVSIAELRAYARQIGDRRAARLDSLPQQRA
jgi:hypothetical protein